MPCVYVWGIYIFIYVYYLCVCLYLKKKTILLFLLCRFFFLYFEIHRVFRTPPPLLTIVLRN
ncbi:Uncharacterized protein APZ42_023896 [Daphnia magna]|uniref:Uncharacterized protein n=1 Tax=Daphnia magna TaxID=35525 RepID=A0A164U943_9CRUS|nr:Uncharacterized protein APZ42_023896 [Daphnia magna]